MSQLYSRIITINHCDTGLNLYTQTLLSALSWPQRPRFPGSSQNIFGSYPKQLTADTLSISLRFSARKSELRKRIDAYLESPQEQLVSDGVLVNGNLYSTKVAEVLGLPKDAKTRSLIRQAAIKIGFQTANVSQAAKAAWESLSKDAHVKRTEAITEGKRASWERLSPEERARRGALPYQTLEAYWAELSPEDRETKRRAVKVARVRKRLKEEGLDLDTFEGKLNLYLGSLKTVLQQEDKQPSDLDAPRWSTFQLDPADVLNVMGDLINIEQIPETEKDLGLLIAVVAQKSGYRILAEQQESPYRAYFLRQHYKNLPAADV